MESAYIKYILELRDLGKEIQECFKDEKGWHLRMAD